MLVRDVMQTKLITASPQTTLPDALKLVAQRRVRHLPVVDSDGALAGIVSDRDLKQAMASPATSLEAHELLFLLDRLRVEQIMTRTVITIGPMSPVEEAARLMVQEKIGALPVMDGGELVGILTETDVLELFVDAMGAGVPSSRLEIFLGEDPAALGDVVATIGTAGVAICRPGRPEEPGRPARGHRPDRDDRSGRGSDGAGSPRLRGPRGLARVEPPLRQRGAWRSEGRVAVTREVGRSMAPALRGEGWRGEAAGGAPSLPIGALNLDPGGAEPPDRSGAAGRGGGPGRGEPGRRRRCRPRPAARRG